MKMLVRSGQSAHAALAPMPDSADQPCPDGLGSGDAPLKVLHVFRYFRPDFTGEGLYLEKLARHCAQRGIVSDVVVERTRADPAGTPPEGIRATHYFGRRGYNPYYFHAAMLFWLLLNAHRYDVAHFHSHVDRLLLSQWIARLRGCRVVQSCTLNDGFGELVNGYRARYRPLVRWLCRAVDAAIGISPRLHADNLRVLPPSRAVLIPQGVEAPGQITPGERAQARARFGFAPDDTVLLYVGGLCARKDVGFLIDNHRALAGAGRVRLLIVGPDLEDDYARDLRARAAAAPNSADIALVGYMDDPSPAYRAADLFVFASRAEGFGNVVIEAMAWGLPVVARRLPGVTDFIVAHGRTGYLFDTAEDYGATVAALTRDPAQRAAIGAAAAAEVRNSFDLAAIASRYAQVYRSILGRRRA